MINYLYWIRSPDHSNIMSEGYVGVTTNVDNRLKQHIYNCEYYKYQYNPDLRKALLSGCFEISIVVEGDRDYIYDLEFKIRPDFKIGWNISKGGVIGLLKHGMTNTNSYDIYKAMKKKIEDNPLLSMSDDWLNDSGVVNFINFYESNKTNGNQMFLPDSGEVSEATVRFMSRSEFFNNKNRIYDLYNNGFLWSIKEIGDHLGIKPNTISTNLKRGFTIRQACGLDLRGRVVNVNGEIYKYNGKLKDSEIELMVKLVNEGVNDKMIGQTLNMHPSNVYRLIKKFKLRG